MDPSEYDTLAERFRRNEGADRAAMEREQSRSSGLRDLADACIGILIAAVCLVGLGAVFSQFRIF